MSDDPEASRWEMAVSDDQNESLRNEIRTLRDDLLLSHAVIDKTRNAIERAQWACREMGSHYEWFRQCASEGSATAKAIATADANESALRHALEALGASRGVLERADR